MEAACAGAYVCGSSRTFGLRKGTLFLFLRFTFYEGRVAWRARWLDLSGLLTVVLIAFLAKGIINARERVATSFPSGLQFRPIRFQDVAELVFGQPVQVRHHAIQFGALENTAE